MSSLTRYCLGLCFTQDLSQVVVLRKADNCKVQDLQGKWNGVGGVVHNHEDTDQAMEREWVEETDTPSPMWVSVGSIWINDDIVITVFGSVTDSKNLDLMKGSGDEVPELAGLWELGNSDYPLAPHMDWLLPLVHGQMIRVHNGMMSGRWRFNVEKYTRL